MVDKIAAILGDEILNSRGYPTLRVEVRLDSGIAVTASVPSGASTGEGEAHELRDRDPARYGGRGVLKAIANLAEITRVLQGRDPTQQTEIDRLLIEADGTEAKSRLGANAIVGVSMAVARAGAKVAGSATLCSSGDELDISPADANDERHQRRSTCCELARFSRIHDRPASGALISRGATLGGRNLSCSKRHLSPTKG